MPGGRPRHIKSVQEFDLLVDLFMQECLTNNEPRTITGLCLYMGFKSKQGFYEYGTGGGYEEYSDSVSRARMLVENGLEQKCSENGGTSGPQFLLRAMHGYDDRRTIAVEPVVVNIEGKYADV